MHSLLLHYFRDLKIFDHSCVDSGFSAPFTCFVVKGGLPITKESQNIEWKHSWSR